MRYNCYNRVTENIAGFKKEQISIIPEKYYIVKSKDCKRIVNKKTPLLGSLH